MSHDADFLDFQAQFNGSTPTLPRAPVAASQYNIASGGTLTLDDGGNDETDDSVQAATRNILGLPDADEETDHHTNSIGMSRTIEGLAAVGQETDDAASGITYNVAGNTQDDGGDEEL